MIVEEVTHFFSDGVYAKQMYLPKGGKAESHKHVYNHLSILASGKVIVEVDGLKTSYTAPTCIEIKAGETHAIYAIDDSMFFCVHATNEKDETKIYSELIKE